MDKKKAVILRIVGLFNVIFSIGGLLFWFNQFSIGSDGALWAIFFIPCYFLLLFSGIFLLGLKSWAIILAIISSCVFIYFSVNVFIYRGTVHNDLSYYLSKSIFYYLSPFTVYTFTSWTPNIYITTIFVLLTLCLSYVKIKQATPNRKILNIIFLSLLFLILIFNMIRGCQRMTHVTKSPRAISAKACRLYAEKRYDEAILYFTESISNTGTDDRDGLSSSYLYRGFCFEEKGAYDQAISDYGEALKIKSKLDFLVYRHRAKVYFKKQEYDKSWEDIHKLEALGEQIEPKFLEDLKRTSGREK